MMKFFKSKKLLIIVTILCAMIMGGMIGLQYFQEPFIVLKTNVKTALGLTTSKNGTSIEEMYYPIMVNGFQLELDESADTLSWVDVPQLTTELSNTIEVGEIDEYDVYIEGELVQSNKKIQLELEELSKGIGIELKFVNKETEEEKLHYIRTLHSSYNNIVSGQGQGDGYYYFALREQYSIYKMDTKGNIAFYKVVNSEVFDFKLHEIGDEIYYSYLQRNADGDITPKLEGVGYMQVKAVIMNAEYEVIDEIRHMSSEGMLGEREPLENHELIMLDVGHYVIAGYIGKEVNNIPKDVYDGDTSSVVACVIQEVKDGELILELDMTDYPELYELSIDKNDFTNEVLPYADYNHLNSVTIDPTDDNFVISFRNIDSVIKIDRNSGEIIWILGGKADQFGLTVEQKFSRQHFARITENGTITVFDNGCSEQQTRVVEYTLDEERMELLEFYEGQVDGVYSGALGSTQRLDSHDNIFLMGWGKRGNDGAIFSEINFDTGEVFLEARCIYENIASYRTYKFNR